MIRIYCDGACRGNPGPGAIGVIALDEEGNEVFAISRAIGNATNNIAEWQALLAAAEEVARRGEASVSFYLDSELVVKQMNGVYKVKNAELKKLKELVMEQLGSAEWSITHIPREKNSKADELANLAFN